MDNSYLSWGTCFSNRTFTVVCAHFVVTSSSVITWFVLTVINVDATVRASPSIDTDTGVVTRRMVQTSGSIFTNIWIHQTFIDILFTELTYNREHRPVYSLFKAAYFRSALQFAKLWYAGQGHINRNCSSCNNSTIASLWLYYSFTR